MIKFAPKINMTKTCPRSSFDFLKLFNNNELEIFKERYCGYVGDLATWAQKCLDSCYDGYEDDDIPSLESFIELEFWDHFDYNEDLGIGFLLV